MDNDLTKMIDDILEFRLLETLNNSLVYRNRSLAAVSADVTAEEGVVNTRDNGNDFGGDYSNDDGSFDGNFFSFNNVNHYSNHCATVFSSHLGGNFGSVKSSHHSSQGS